MLLELKVPELIESEYCREIQIDPNHTVTISVRIDQGCYWVKGTICEIGGRAYTIERRGKDCEVLLARVARSLSACYTMWQEPSAPRLVWRNTGRA